MFSFLSHSLPTSLDMITTIATTLLFFLSTFLVDGTNVSYDERALVIDGQRRVLISGSIHYPRSTPEVILGNCLQKRSLGV